MYLPAFNWFLFLYTHHSHIIRKFRGNFDERKLRSRNLGPKSPVPGPASPSKRPSRTVTQSMMEPGRRTMDDHRQSFRGLNKVRVSTSPTSNFWFLLCGWDVQRKSEFFPTRREQNKHPLNEVLVKCWLVRLTSSQRTGRLVWVRKAAAKHVCIAWTCSLLVP